MSSIIGISVITALCIFGFAFGAAVLYTALRDNIYIFALIGGIIFVVSSIGFYYLDEPFTDVQNKIAENGTEYKLAIMILLAVGIEAVRMFNLIR